MPYAFYDVLKGKDVIARIHGVRINDLVEANNLNRRATIYPGQNLRLPAPGEKTIALASARVRERKTEAPARSKPSPSLMTGRSKWVLIPGVVTVAAVVTMLSA